MEADFSGIFGADFKILASLGVAVGRCAGRMGPPHPEDPALSKLPYERQLEFLAYSRADSERIGMNISRNDRHRGFVFTSFATCLHTVLVAVDTLFPDPADRFLDVGDAD